MYNADQLFKECNKYAHGKSRIAALRHAVEEADRNQDAAAMIQFRAEICWESNFYDDSMDMLLTFPEMLALSDKYPETPSSYHYAFNKAVEHVVYIYKMLLEACTSFYQIPLQDCLKYLEDFKQRSLALGNGLRPYYEYKYVFYQNIDEEQAEEAFHAFERAPRGYNCDCAACERNLQIRYYLNHNNEKRAVELAEAIDNFVLRCGDRMSAWLRMKTYFMEYYQDRGDFEQAAEYCRLVEKNMNGVSEYQRFDKAIYCYAHTDLGRALSLYKEHWKDRQTWHCPMDCMEADRNMYGFFKQLAGECADGMIKLQLDNSFPLYQESGKYNIAELCDYYYQRARETAEKFDKRNGTDYYIKKLEML